VAAQADRADASSPRRSDASTPTPQRRFATLDTLVPGECNRLALHAARMVLEGPGKISPLLVHGPTAIGKTHLLEGIYTEVRRGRGHAVYLSAEQFTNAFLEALRGSGLPSFRRKYRGVQWLLLDDVQFFCGKKATISELLHTIDTALREGRQLVLAADRPPQELPGLGEELITRLQSGLTCAMQPPDQPVRLGIVRAMARELDFAPPETVAEFIAASLTAHARELAGALKLLKVTCHARGCPPTLTLARETLADMIRVSSPAVGLAEIEQAVCSVFGLESRKLQAADGSRGVNQPRMLAMWLARKYTRAALSEIGRYFGRRSHSTVISAQKRVDGWVDRGQSLRVSDHEWPAAEAIRRVEARLRVG
jgi:chromosomal replication initiator protein